MVQVYELTGKKEGAATVTGRHADEPFPKSLSINTCEDRSLCSSFILPFHPLRRRYFRPSGKMKRLPRTITRRLAQRRDHRLAGAAPTPAWAGVRLPKLWMNTSRQQARVNPACHAFRHRASVSNSFSPGWAGNGPNTPSS